MIVWGWSFTSIRIVGIGRERVIETEERCRFVVSPFDHRELGVRGELSVGEVGCCDDGSGVVLEGAVDPGRTDGHYDYWDSVRYIHVVNKK